MHPVVYRKPHCATHTRHMLGMLGRLWHVPKYAEHVPSMRLDDGITGRTHHSRQIDRANRNFAIGTIDLP